MTRSLFSRMPHGWRTMPAKHAVSLNPEVLPENTPEDTEIAYVDIAALEGGDAAVSLSPKALTFGTAPSRARRVLRKGDTILSTVRTYLRAVANFPEASEGLVASTGFAVLRPNGQLNPRFAYWAALSEPFIENVVAHSEGVSYPAINPSVLGSLHMPVPPLSEQERIANFLDEQTARIDALIAEKERLDELLGEYRSSLISAAVTGQPIASLMPSSRATGEEAGCGGGEGGAGVAFSRCVRRLKYAIEACVNGVWGDEPNGKDDMVVVRVADFDRSRGLAVLGESPTVRAIPESARNRRVLRPGDLLIEKSGGGEQQPVGNVVLFTDSRPAVCSNFIARMPVMADCDSRFVGYVFRALYVEGRNVPHIKQTSGIQNLDLESYLNEMVWLPTKREQERIANFLDEQTARIDALIAEKERLDELLGEYRSSLISAAVTGQPIASLMPSSRATGEEAGCGGGEGGAGVAFSRCVRRLKYAIEACVNGVWGDEPNGKDDMVVVRVADFDRSRGLAVLGESPTVRAIPESARNRRVLRPGDLLIEKSGGGEQQPVGNVVLFTDSRPAVCSNFIARMPVMADCDSRFVGYVFRALYVEGRNVPHIKQTSGIQNLDLESYLNEMVWLPTKREQERIANFLDEQTARIDALREHVRAHIERLREYRSSLISAAVTGQLDLSTFKAAA